MNRKAVAGVAAAYAIGAAVVVTIVAQQAPQPQPPTFRTEANYVRVDVYPTRNGAPVTDLAAADFEVLDNGVPQKIEQFERVVIRAAGPQETRVEPNNVAESRSMAENPRARLFVVFLDTYHVDVAASRRIRKPLVDMLDRAIGRDDLVAVMTPEMSATDITFARKTTTIDGMLTRYWHWGERDRDIPPDPEDQEYGFCYPNEPATSRCTDQNGIAAEMIDRRHEKRALDALEDLVRYLRGVREERKAILAISNGWLLFRPNPALARPLTCGGAPTGGSVNIDPRSGRLTTKDPTDAIAPRSKCDIDRLNLAQLDDDQEFRYLMDEANAANASFYPIDPRGLAVFDTPIVRTDVPGAPPPMTPLGADRAMLTARLTSLRTIADNTDGLAIVDTNDLSAGLRRVADDLSSYYLLGYYSSNKLDGRFHKITVRVKRPGVEVRARRGYLAASPSALAIAGRGNGTPSAPAPGAPPAAEALAIAAAIAPLGAIARDVPVRLQAVAGWQPTNVPHVWVAGEVSATDEWKGGAEADVMLTSAAGETVAMKHVTVAAGSRSFLVALSGTSALAPGDYAIRVRARSAASTSAANETMTIALRPAPAATGAMFMRRGPMTGNRDIPAADLRFRRSEQMRVECPAPGATDVTARLLDRTGKALTIPVTAAVREDPDGTRWQTAHLALAALAPGDYIVEIANSADKTLVAFRVIQ